MQERTQHNVEEFTRIQNYMLLAEKDSNVYKEMYIRYSELKALLEIDGVNMTIIDRVKG